MLTSFGSHTPGTTANIPKPSISAFPRELTAICIGYQSSMFVARGGESLIRLSLTLRSYILIPTHVCSGLEYFLKEKPFACGYLDKL